MQNNNPTVGALRVWHIPQVPGKSFRVNVSSIEQAKLMIDTLANYDLFQLQNRIKPDYCNASGLERYESDAGDGVPGWCEWYDEETGDEIVRINMSRAIEMDRAAANLGDRVQVPAELVGGGE